MDIFSLSELFALWRQIEHIGALTGLSLTALAGCVAALYFCWPIAIVRHLAILIIGAVVSGYFVGVYMHQVGRDEVLAEWSAAKIEAARAAKARDIQIEMEVHKTYLPEIADLRRQADDRQQQVESYERQMLAMATGGSCRLGVDAFRLRGQPGKK